MVEEKLLTIREVASILKISEKEVIDLAESGQIPAYKVGGVYLRFKRQQIEELKNKLRHSAHKPTIFKEFSFRDWISDFFYFNDFYILSALIILLILFIIFQGY